MIDSWRTGFYAGVGLTLLTGLFLVWLWQPERQVDRHTEHLLRKLEQKNWAAAADFIANEYKDQWGDDRSLVLARTQEVFQYVHGIKIQALEPVTVTTDGRRGTWKARIVFTGNAGDEGTTLLKERVNSLSTPFELKWRQMSGKPWDWKLVYVGNSELQIPAAGFE
jgi:hypothetical protein